VAIEGIRDVTDDEVAFYRENGWVLIEGFVAPELVSELLGRIQERMGAEAGQPMRGDYKEAGVAPALQAAWQNYDYPSEDDEWIREFCLSDGLTRATTRMMGRDARNLADHVMCKMPVTGAGGKTPWHNDIHSFPLDRAGGLTIWIPLVDCPPEKGTMRFLSGSHRERPLGRYVHNPNGQDMVDANPWLLDRYEISPPLHMRAGDATIHDTMTIHSAPENRTDTPRFVYGSHRFPADALYTATPQRFFDGLGLKPNEPLDHPKFPLLRASS
jgi:hypothetical protein